MMSDCIFCKIVKGELPCVKVYETEKVLAFLDLNPVNQGHTLVIPKEHFENLSSTTDEFLSELVVVSKKIGAAVLAATGSVAFNLTVNNGKEAGQVVAHTHFHIIPRFNGDGLRLWSGKAYAAGEMEAMGEKIKQYVEKN